MKFRKKPIVIDAELFDGGSGWPIGVRRVQDGTDVRHVIFDDAQNGDVPVNVGDWIITGVQGERYPCRADIFAATYEPVADEGSS